MSVKWEYISINNCKVKMQVDTGADSTGSTVISSKKWTELRKPIRKPNRSWMVR